MSRGATYKQQHDKQCHVARHNGHLNIDCVVLNGCLPDSCFVVGAPPLQVLGLEDNAVSSWIEVLRLAGLPRLQRLALSGNPLSSVFYPHSSSIAPAALFSSSPPAAAPSSQQQQPAASAAASGPSGECTHTTQVAAAASGQQQQQRHSRGQAPFAHLQALLLGD